MPKVAIPDSENSALRIQFVRLESVRVIAEHVEVLPPKHRMNDLSIQDALFPPLPKLGGTIPVPVAPARSTSGAAVARQ